MNMHEARAGLVLAVVMLGACDKAPAGGGLPGPAALAAGSADAGLATDPSTGDLLLSWIGGDSASYRLYLARSRDGGRTWSDPSVVTPDTGEVHPHGEASPRIVAASGNRIALVWAQNIKVEGRKWPASRIRVARSLDGGTTWLPAVTVNDDTTGVPTGHTFHGAAWSGDSGIVAAWLDERGGATAEAHPPMDAMDHSAHGAVDEGSEPDSRVYAVVSHDFGATWSANRPMWGAACPCCRVNLARRPTGAVEAAWRQHFPGNVRDVVVAEVRDSVPVPTRVNVDGWVYPGCPHTGPAVAVGADGATHVAWYTGKEGAAGIYYERMENGTPATPVALLAGKGVATSHASVVATPAGGAVAAYDALAPGRVGIRVAVLDAKGSLGRQVDVPGGAGGKYPQVAIAGDSLVLVAWTDGTGAKPIVRLGTVGL